MIGPKPLKTLLRTVAYRAGALTLARTRLRHALTVIMLHRVMDAADPDFPYADPEYTLSTPIFDQLLDFFEQHYRLVSLKDVVRAREGTGSLPDHALLITFDDGWADNLRYAAPLLQRRAIPAVVFAALEPILSPEKVWWQEQVFAAARAGVLEGWVAQHAAPHGLPRTGNTSAAALALVVRLGQMSESARAGLLAELPTAPYRARMIMTPDDLVRLPEYGIAVALHGFSHLPLTEVDDIETDLMKARTAIADLLDGKAMTSALALPHSRYNDAVIEAAQSAGIKHIFTGDPLIQLTIAGVPASKPTLGRICFTELQVIHERRCLNPAAAAGSLWSKTTQPWTGA